MNAQDQSLSDQLDARAARYGNRFLLEPAPDNQLPEHGMPGGQADRRGEPPSQLHRPRRVSADRGDRAALHPHARPPLGRPRRDDRRAHAGLLGGHHARRAVAQVEVARAPRAGREGHLTAEPRVRPGTCTSRGRSSAATSTSSRGSSRCSPTSTRSGPRTWSPTSTRTRSGWPPSSAPRSPDTPTTSQASTTFCSGSLAKLIEETGRFRLIGREEDEQLPLVAFQLAEDRGYDEFDVASQLAAERGWMLPAYTLPPDADHVRIMRALVKQTLGHSLVTTLAGDIAEACSTLDQKGGLHEIDRRRVKTGTGY